MLDELLEQFTAITKNQELASKQARGSEQYLLELLMLALLTRQQKNYCQWDSGLIDS